MPPTKLASYQARVWVREVCEQAPAHVTCKADHDSVNSVPAVKHRKIAFLVEFRFK
ncbi:hypothetical protein CCACVL1_09797 [Corchorus capsularis]|uniref:Uncharacterized protein n=1 Tax=Corchorus capsularis TaxID=210143 RepID=A0A1R3IU89_COCAP|nr:hypothetical protein CCACVL1_09797 [Corchorus capsularis]